MNCISLLSYAQAYSRLGFSLLPCYSIVNGKCSCGDPNCKEKNWGKHPKTPNGCKDATSDPKKLVEYFGHSRPTNIALATGKASGVIVIDEDDLTTMAKLEQRYGTLPKTVSAISGRGTKHRYFKYDPSFANVKNTKLLESDNNIDIRCDGGYVIAPPSRHKSGNEYCWQHDPDTTPLADAPAWLVGLLPRKTETETPAKPITKTETITVSQRGVAARETGAITLTMNDPDGARIAAYLANVPPAIEHHGNMMATWQLACRLIELFGHLRSDEQLLNDLEPWNNRCEPPWTDKELRRKLSDARTKTGIEYVSHEGTSSDLVASTTETPTNETPAITTTPPLPWPTLNEAALTGLGGDIVKRIEPQTETDNAALLVTFLTCFGCAIGRNPHFLVEGTKHHANVFSCLVGRSSRARKGTSLGRIKDVFRDLVPPTLSGLSTGEGLIHEVRDDTTKALKDGKTFEDIPGVKDKRLWIVESELARTLSAIKRENNTLSSILRDSWDDGNLRVATRANPLTATAAHIGMTAHITIDELGKVLNSQESFNGFANRFLFVVVKKSKDLPDGGDDIFLDDLRSRLRSAIDNAKKIGRMIRSEDCKKLWRQAYSFLVAEKTGIYDAITSRAEAITLRLSMLYALLDGSSTIHVQHLQAALSIWCYSDHSAEYLFEKTPSATGTETRAKIVELIDEPLLPQRGDGDGITTTGRDTEVTKTNTIVPGSTSLTEQEFIQELTGQTIPTPAATLVELLDFRNRHGGRFERRADGMIALVILDTPVPAAITQAVIENQTILVSMAAPVPTEPDHVDSLADEEFLNELRGRTTEYTDAELEQFARDMERAASTPSVSTAEYYKDFFAEMAKRSER